MNGIRDYYSPGLALRWALATLRLAAIDLTYGWLNVLQLLRSMLTGGWPFIIQVRRTGHQFKVVSAVDVWTIDEIFIRDEYVWDRIHIPPDAVIIDVGANIGGFSVWAAGRYPSSAIYAFEPFPGSYKLLQHNLARNNIRRASTFNLAVWSHPCRLVIDTQLPYTSMYSTHEIGAPPPTSLSIPATSLDAIFEDHALSRCDLLKIDCEGAEYEILLNASPFTLDRVNVILMEYHDNRTAFTHADLQSFLCQHGFEVELRPNPAIKDTGYLFAARHSVPPPG